VEPQYLLFSTLSVYAIELESKMGRESLTDIAVVYGAVIALPTNPSAILLCKRLLEVEDSFFATAARAVPKEDLDDENGLPEQIAKSARIVRSVLVSKDDTDAMTEEECATLKKRKCYGDSDDSLEEEGIGIASKAAIDKIVGEGHGLELKGYKGWNYWDNDDDGILLLEHVESRFIGRRVDAGVSAAMSLNIPTMEGKEEIDGNIRQVLRALGLEAEGDPGWQLVVTHSVYE
jgi:hypothetical protein